MKKLIINKRIQWLIYGLAILGFSGSFYLAAGLLTGSFTTVQAQQDPFLSQRLIRIEQQLSTIESRLNRIDQLSRFPGPSNTPDPTNDQYSERRLLQSEIETLRLRVAETECGLLQLDERTLSDAARQARKNLGTGGENDICRKTPNVPLQLSARP